MSSLKNKRGGVGGWGENPPLIDLNNFIKLKNSFNYRDLINRVYHETFEKNGNVTSRPYTTSSLLNF